MKKQINIFIISPSDVNPEREVSRDVCRYLNKAVGKDIEINSISWEYKPQNYYQDAQTNFNKYKSSFTENDIAIILLWERLGSFIPNNYIGQVTKKSPVTGTQWEIEELMAYGRIPLFFYFKIKNKLYNKDELEEGLKQKRLLDSFLEDIDLKVDATVRGHHKFNNKNELKKKLMSHLSSEIESKHKINISLQDDNMTSLNESRGNGIHQNYYVGLYIFFALTAIVIFQSIIAFEPFSKNIHNIIFVFIVSLLVVIVMGLYTLPTKVKHIHKSSFKSILKKLFKRALLIVGFTLLLSMSIVLSYLGIINSFKKLF